MHDIVIHKFTITSNIINLTFNQDWSIHIIFTISTFNIQGTNCTQNEVDNYM